MTFAVASSVDLKIWDRIRASGDFKRAYSLGKKFFTPTLGVFILPHSVPSRPKIGYVASAAKVGNAVQRNRAKRRMRALARQSLMPRAASDCDYVLIATPKTVLAEFTALQKDLHDALSRLKVIRHDLS